MCKKNTYPNCKFVSAKGLGANPDNLHFSAEALYEFGIRYFEAYKEFDIEKLISVSEVKKDDSIRTEIELR